jgi:hypothetical protein
MSGSYGGAKNHGFSFKCTGYSRPISDKCNDLNCGCAGKVDTYKRDTLEGKIVTWTDKRTLNCNSLDSFVRLMAGNLGPRAYSIAFN